MMKRISHIILLLLLALSVTAQDIHYSQFYMTPLNMNPAATGVFNGDMRFTANYRFQWYSVPVSYSSVAGSFDSKVLAKKTGNNIIGAGFQFNYDKAGDSKLSLLQLNGSLAYALQLNKRNYLSAGTQVGFAQRSFSDEALTFDSQFNGDVFDPGLPTQELFTDKTFAFTDINIGLNYRYVIDDRTNVNIGGSLQHVNTPKQSFFDATDVRLPRKWSGILDATFMVSESIDLLPGFLYSRQGTYTEMVPSLNLKYHLSQVPGKKIGLYIGGKYRVRDAIVPAIGMSYNALRVGLSYDINISPFQAASTKQGGPELGLIYIITKVKPIDAYKSCPIF